MRVLSIVHQTDAGAGVFADALAAAEVAVDVWRADAEPPPRAPYDAVMTFGGAVHPDAGVDWMDAELALLGDALAAGTPVLGVCLGAELLAAAAGARVGRAAAPEIGWVPVELTAEAAADPMIGPLPGRFEALEWHSYQFGLPPGAVALARSPTCLQACRIGNAAWAIQFHAEVALADFTTWANDYRSDPDAVRNGVDPESLLAATRPRIAAWNALGRGLCSRFIDFAAGR